MRRTRIWALALTGAVTVTACGSSSTEVSVSLSPAPTTRPASAATTAPAPQSDAPAASPTPGEEPSEPAPGSDVPANPDAEPTLKVIGQVPEPIDLQPRAGDPRLFIASRGGIIRTITDDVIDMAPWIDISSLLTAGGERGLLAFAFSPDGGQLFVHYSDKNGDTQIDRWQLDGAGAPIDDSRSGVLSIDQPHSNHNGGRITFGPDGMLYVGMGDGGSQGDPDNRSQNLGDLLGKLLRIDVTTDPSQPYTVPADNPFVGVDGARPEVWSYGLRNPWRFTFDRSNGELWIGDVGQNAAEEVNRSATGRGVNYGWKAFEGKSRYDDGVDAPGAESPAFEYRRDEWAGCSVTGGVVYRGNALAKLQGTYVFGDYCWNTVRFWDGSTIIDTGWPATNVVSFDTDSNGEIYVLTFDSNVAKIVPA
jgi:glucose/arabinose dehydrogenase